MYGTGDSHVSYPFFSGYERDEAFPQDTDLSPVPLVESILNLEIIQRQLEIVLCGEAGVSQIAVYAVHGKPRLLAVGGVCLEYDSQCCASYRQVLIQNSGANITIFADVGKLFARKCYFHPQPMGEPEVGCHKNHAAQGQK